MSTDIKYWPEPKSRAIGFFSDSSLYAEVLKIASKYDYFTKSDLDDSLVNHVKGLLYIDRISGTATDNLIRELFLFKWIGHYLSESKKAEENYKMFTINKGSNFFSITDNGRFVLELYQNNREAFFDKLIYELYNIYIIPGWFVQRLWDLNKKGQGEIVIPSPLKKWKPISRKWDDNRWNSDLTEQVEKSFNNTIRLFPSSFPIDYKSWLEGIQITWEQIGNTKPRKVNQESKHIYAPRKRLTMAMKETAINLLFNNRNPATQANDFNINRPPLRPRTYSYWCARLEEIGLLNYTDYNPYFSGRILYPVCSFKKTLPSKDFRFIDKLNNPNGAKLCLYRPLWESARDTFYETLQEEYKRIYVQVKSLYISIQDLRDSVCRILRLSNFMFDRFVEIASTESLYGKSNYRIALETDIREDQRKSLQRKPVYIYNKFVSLIAITH